MNRFLKVALIGAVVATSISAEDFLAKATNGALSDTQIGVINTLGKYWIHRIFYKGEKQWKMQTFTII